MARNSIYVDHLRGVSLFEGLTKKQLELVAGAGSQVPLKAGAVVMKEGHIGHTAIILLSGSMVVRRNGRKLREVGVGEVLGEMALVDDQPRSTTIECVTDCEVFEIIGGQFRAVLDGVPEIRNHLLAVLAGRVRELDARRYV